MKNDHGRDLTGDEMARMLDEFVNANDSKKFEEFAATVTERAHRTLQQSMMRLFLRCIEKWAATEENRYDARNEATVLLCRKIVKGTGDKYDRHLPTI